MEEYAAIVRRKRAVQFGAGVVLLPLLYVFSCYVPSDSSRTNAEQYSVYSSYIDTRISEADFKQRQSKIVISSQTDALYEDSIWRVLVGVLPRFRGDLASAYGLFFSSLFSGEAATVQPRFGLSRPYQMVSAKELPETRLRADSTRQILFTFSRAAFNADHSEALFRVSLHCGSLCGEESYVLMRRNGGQWIVRRNCLIGVA